MSFKLERFREDLTNLITDGELLLKIFETKKDSVFEKFRDKYEYAKQSV